MTSRIPNGCLTEPSYKNMGSNGNLRINTEAASQPSWLVDVSVYRYVTTFSSNILMPLGKG